MKKIVIFVPYNPFPPKGGGTIRVWKMAEGLDRKGWRVIIICYGNFGKTFKVGKILIKQLRFPLGFRIKSMFLNLFVKKLGQKKLLLRINRMRAELKDDRIEDLIIKINPNVAQCESIWFCKSAIETARILGKPVILTEHNIESKLMESLGLDSSSFVSIEKEILKNVDYVICVSKDDEKILREWGIKNVKTIPGGFELKITKKIDIRKMYGLPKNCFIGIFVGSAWLPNVEAVNNLLKIAEETKDNICFLVVGSVKKAFTKKKIPENVIFTGYVSDNILANIYDQCDIGVLPLISGGGAKQKTIDLINAKIPFVATSVAVQGLTEIFGLKNLVNCIIEDDISKFPDWILRLKDDRKLLRKLKVELKHLAVQTWDEMVKKYERIYEILLNQQGRFPKWYRDAHKL